MVKQKTGKINITISFDKIVADKIEWIQKTQGTNKSALVNQAVRKFVMDEEEYYREQAKEYNLKMQTALFMKEQAKAQKEVEDKKRNI